MRSSTRAPIALAALLALITAAGGGLSAKKARAGTTLVFERLNGTYEDLGANLRPVVSGPVTVRISSPSHRLTLIAHRLELAPLGGGEHSGRLTARFRGQAHLTVGVELGGLPSELEDDVLVPEQERTVDGRFRVDRRPDGYALTMIELPPDVPVEVESGLGKDLVAWCGRLTFFLPGDSGCDGLDRALSNPRVPLPKPGSKVFLEAADLTPEERAALDAYLAAAG